MVSVPNGLCLYNVQRRPPQLKLHSCATLFLHSSSAGKERHKERDSYSDPARTLMQERAWHQLKIFLSPRASKVSAHDFLNHDLHGVLDCSSIGSLVTQSSFEPFGVKYSTSPEDADLCIWWRQHN